jgi:hypothetical protein
MATGFRTDAHYASRQPESKRISRYPWLQHSASEFGVSSRTARDEIARAEKSSRLNHRCGSFPNDPYGKGRGKGAEVIQRIGLPKSRQPYDGFGPEGFSGSDSHRDGLS